LTHCLLIFYCFTFSAAAKESFAQRQTFLSGCKGTYFFQKSQTFYSFSYVFLVTEHLPQLPQGTIQKKISQ